MTSFKTVDDLDEDNIASIGGAMGTWPYRTLWYLCRWERTGQTDPGVVRALRDQNTDALRELETLAADNGLDDETLANRRRALEDADVDALRGALASAYQDEFGGMNECPFEREGSDMACHRCPVAANALSRLSDNERGPRVEPEP